MIINEKWETIKDFPNYMISESGIVLNKTRAGLVKPYWHKHGHRCVRLWNSGKTRLLKMYRLKAIAFIPNPENKREVNHLDGNRANESIDNLEWTTGKENMQHSFKTGLCKGFFKRNAEHQFAKLTREDVLKIRSLRGRLAYKHIAAIFNITYDHAWRVANLRQRSDV